MNTLSLPEKKFMPKKFILICLLNFFIAALMGLTLRYANIDTIPINYRFLTHAHSLVAMLGWVYLILYTLFYYYFTSSNTLVFKRLFWITEISVLGMMFSFPFQGYGAISVAFSSLHIFCSYYFVFLIWKHQNISSKPVVYLLKTALVFMLISTIGVWCLGPIVSTLGQVSVFYKIAIQFFLHFQFNGWFLIGVLTLLFYFLNIKESPLFKWFLCLIILATILTFALPVHWFIPHKIFLWFNGLGILFQLITLLILFKIIKNNLSFRFENEPKIITYTLVFTLFCYVIKTVLQSVLLIPEIATNFYIHQNFIIGFIHFLMLGVITGFIFVFLFMSKFLQASKANTIGLICFLIGFITTEVLLILQGYFYYFKLTPITNFREILFIASVFLPVAIGIFLVHNFKLK